MSPEFRTRPMSSLTGNNRTGGHRAGRRLPRTRLMLQALEERTVPTVFTVLDGGDTGGVDQLRAIWDAARTNGVDDTINFDVAVTSVTLLSALNTYTENNKLTLNGNGKTITTIIAAPSSRIFDINVGSFNPTITFTDISLQGGNVTTGYGGAIRVDNEVLVLTNVAFTNNTAESGGGAISVTSATSSITINGCDFTTNTATTPTVSSLRGGGAIFLGGGITVALNTSTFDGNRAVSGSALFSASSINLNSDSSTFKNGVSTGASGSTGGAIFCNSGSTTILIDHATATGNVTLRDGGFINTYNAGASVTIQNSTISSNTATGRGAVRVFGGATTNVTNCTFSNNTAGGDGGAISASNTITVTKSTFTGNTSAGRGGAIDGATGTTSITTSIFKNNTASGATGGGAIRLSGGSTVSFSQFESNTATGAGGAIYYNSGTITINNSTFYRNTATTTGGAIQADSSGSTTVNQSTFNKNTAAGNGGGAIANTAGGALTINNSTIYENTATGSATTTGGAGILRASSSSTVPFNLISTIVSNNYLQFGARGVDIYSSSNTVSVAGTKNLIGTNDNSSITFTTPASNQLGINVSKINGKLSPLTDNGGEAAKALQDGSHVRTMALIGSSPALNQGLANGFINDQRGVGFARDDGSGVDVGAHEGVAAIPSAQLTSAPNVPAAGNSTYAFAVTYEDDSGFDTTTFDLDDVTVNGPGFSGGQKATAINVTGGGKTYVVTYTIPAPTGGWGALNAGVFNLGAYSVTMNAGQVSDDSATFVPGDFLGTFKTGFGITFTVSQNSEINDGNYLPGQLSFREALLLSNNNVGATDTIAFDATLFNTATTISLTAGSRSISDSVVITGPVASLTFDANKTNQQFVISDGQNVTISGLSFTGFSAAAAGAVFNMGSGSISLTGTTFSNNTSTSTGGAVLSASKAVSATIANSTFTNNTASVSGGVMRFAAGAASAVSISSSIFTGNTSGSTGGVLYSSTLTSVTINASTFSNNKATTGGVFRLNATSSSISINNSTLTNNTATSNGGVADLIGSVTIANSILSGNSAGGSGGAVYLGALSTTASISSSIFSNNTASSGSGGGGAVRLATATATFNNNQFNSNTASSTGGAIGATASASITVSGSTFQGNTAASSGGAINHSGTVAMVVNQSTFTRNTAAGSNGGGAIAVTATGGLTVNNSTVYDNTVSGSGASGGGMVFLANGAIKLVSTIAAGNKITGSGTGGVDIHSALSLNLDATNHHNLIGNNDNDSITFADVTTNQIGTTASPIDPSLGALGDNGGVVLLDGSHVQTMIPMAGGPAVDKGDPNGFTTDQRGTGYARTYISLTDVGAAELLPAPPTVTGIVFGDGTNQRSTVRQIIVTFSEAVTFSPSVASAFTLHRTGTGLPLADVTLTATPPTGSTNSVTITFSGAMTESGGSLIDGLYDIYISAAQVFGLGGALDGNGDTIPGGTYQSVGTIANKHFRYYGDENGDGTVNQTDFNAFRLAFLAGPSTIFDFDNDGQVSQPDFNAFRLRFLGSP